VHVVAGKNILDDALKLSGRERAELAAKLLDSLADEPEHEVESAWAQELERRAREVLANESVLEDWGDVRARLRDTVKGLRS
jgi:putative addiction module component (TIGR02574 family)